MCKYNNNNKRIKKRIEEIRFFIYREFDIFQNIFSFLSLIKLTSIADFYRIKVISLTPKKM